MTSEEHVLSAEASDCARYLRIFSIGLVAAAALHAAVLLAIDPFGLLGTRLLPPFGVRPNDGGERVIKALEIAARPHSVLLAGNSRVQLGLDPKSPALGGALAYNAGLPGATIPEQVAVVRYALRRNRALKTIVWALDDDGFSREGAGADFPISPLAGAGARQAALRYMVGGKAVLGVPKLFWRAGRGEKVRFDGLYVLSERAARLSALQSFDLALRPMSGAGDARPPPAIAAARSASTEAIRTTVDSACAKGVAVHLMLPPFHVWYGTVFAMSGLARTSDPIATRRDLAALARGLNGRHGLGCVDIWDFTGSEAAMVSNVPDHEPSPIWWDAIHFRAGFGDELLSCVFGSCHVQAARRLDLLPDAALDASGALPGSIVRSWKDAHPETVRALAARFGLIDRP